MPIAATFEVSSFPEIAAAPAAILGDGPVECVDELRCLRRRRRQRGCTLTAWRWSRGSRVRGRRLIGDGALGPQRANRHGQKAVRRDLGEERPKGVARVHTGSVAPHDNRQLSLAERSEIPRAIDHVRGEAGVGFHQRRIGSATRGCGGGTGRLRVHRARHHRSSDERAQRASNESHQRLLPCSRFYAQARISYHRVHRRHCEGPDRSASRMGHRQGRKCRRPDQQLLSDMTRARARSVLSPTTRGTQVAAASRTPRVSLARNENRSATFSLGPRRNGRVARDCLVARPDRLRAGWPRARACVHPAVAGARRLRSPGARLLSRASRPRHLHGRLRSGLAPGRREGLPHRRRARGEGTRRADHSLSGRQLRLRLQLARRRRSEGAAADGARARLELDRDEPVRHQRVHRLVPAGRHRAAARA